MKRFFLLRRHQAFSLVELLVIVVILAMLASLLLPALVRSKQKAIRIKCTNNLKQVGIGFRLFSTDNGDKFPMNVLTNKSAALQETNSPMLVARYFLMMTNALMTPKVVLCPSDKRHAATNIAALKDENISYFVGLDADETQPGMLLAGDRNLSINGVPAKHGHLALQANDKVGWTKEMHRTAGNAALGDGSIQSLTSQRLQDSLRNADGITNRLAIP